jgi:hypothetical protein
MTNELLAALGADRDQIERSLREAHSQLIPLKNQVRELELLTARARSILDLADPWVPWPPLATPSRPITLHEAIAEVLTAHRNGWMRTSHIAQEIARRGLYRRKDGLPPATRDVSARISTYAGWFRREGWYVQLRISPPGTRRFPFRYVHPPSPWPE